MRHCQTFAVAAFVRIFGFTGDVSHLCQISPQLDPRRHLLGPDRPLGQPGRAEEDASAEVAAVVVGSHAPGLLHEGRRNSERAQLGQTFSLI